MSAPRTAIPANLERDLMHEAGWRCAICKTIAPLQIDHIEEWSKVQAHEFNNMIVLCANCHGLKKNSSDPRHINSSNLRRIKSNLMMLNGRYSDLERRIIEVFRDAVKHWPEAIPETYIPERMWLLARYLIQDGLVASHVYQSSLETKFPDGTTLRDDTMKLTLTPQGRTFVENLNQAN